MTAAAEVTRDEFEALEEKVDYSHKSMDYLVVIHRQTEQMGQSFASFRSVVNSRFGGMENRIDHLGNRVYGTEVRMENLEVRMDSLQHQMNAVEGKVDGLSAEVSDIKRTLDLILEKLS